MKKIINNAHLSTIIPSLFRKVPRPDYKRLRITTPDEDFFHVDTLIENNKKMVILLHGLEGSAKEHYIMDHANYYHAHGRDVFALNFRSCSGELNNTLKLYHSGDTGDLRQLVNYILKEKDYETLELVGFSLGGNVLLKYLGEEGENVSKKILKATAISVPIDLRSCSYQLASGFNRLYSLNFMRTLKKKVKFLGNKHSDSYLKSLKSKKMMTFIEFDDLVTAPLNNFKNNEEYWEKSSSKPYLKDIAVATTLVNAKNDPFLDNSTCYPGPEEINNPRLKFIYPELGGHVGVLKAYEKAY